MKAFFSLFAAVLMALPAMAQSSHPLIPSDKPLTWLGMDFTQTRLLGSANQFGDAGAVTTAEIRDKYAPGWNQLFIDEIKKYDVAKYTKRSSVDYAIDVAGKANKNISDNFFTTNEADFARLKESDIRALVKKYDYMGRKGIGLIFFVEGLSKPREEASVWLAVVDMDKHELLSTRREVAKAGGFGFRNYWAKSFLGVLKTAKD